MSKTTRSVSMKFAAKLTQANKVLMKRKKEFTGTAHAISQQCDRVYCQQIQNLLNGKTQPWNVSAHLMLELIELYRTCGLKLADFKRPPSG